jgi:hypothetical protein
MDMQNYVVEVTQFGQRVGFVRINEREGIISSDESIPRHIVSTIVIQWYQDNYLFGDTKDGYEWR